MMGRSVSLRTSGIITVWTLPPRLRMPKTGNLAGCAASASAFANPAKIAFVHLDKPFDRQTILQLPSDDLTEPMKEIGGRLAVDARQIRRAPSRHPSDKKLRQSILRLFLQTTATYPHSPILDPLPIWHSPKGFIIAREDVLDLGRYADCTKLIPRRVGAGQENEH